MADTSHPSFPQPSNPNIAVWRYMDFAKFIALLEKRCLFFSRAHLLGDPFEGSVSKLNHQRREYVIENAATDLQIQRTWPITKIFKTPEELRKHFTHYSSMVQRGVQECMVSCWHMSEHESAAMWKLYSKSDESVCIRSSYAKLSSALPQWVFLGRVTYADYTTGFIPELTLFSPLMHKRKSFEHEREARALVWENLEKGSPTEKETGSHEIRERMTDAGINVRIEPEALIDEILINPASAQWFVDVVSMVSKRICPSIPVNQSSLLGTPLY
jgi:hypothetical protein